MPYIVLRDKNNVSIIDPITKKGFVLLEKVKNPGDLYSIYNEWDSKEKKVWSLNIME